MSICQVTSSLPMGLIMDQTITLTLMVHIILIAAAIQIIVMGFQTSCSWTSLKITFIEWSNLNIIDIQWVVHVLCIDIEDAYTY